MTLSSEILLQIVSLCVLLASAETLHGIFRAAVLAPRIGKPAALKVGIVTGSLLAFALCWWRVPAMGLTATFPLLLTGLIAALFMAAFDAVLGRWLLRRTWRKVLDDFNPATGNYLLFGLVSLACFPWMVMRLQGA